MWSITNEIDVLILGSKRYESYQKYIDNVGNFVVKSDDKVL